MKEENINFPSIRTVVNDVEDAGEVTEQSLHTQQEYDKVEDSFTRYKMLVEDAYALYGEAEEKANISKGLGETIKRLSEPFRRGHFTLAVVGKMSAGKSTFINALLENHDLLPTGHFQTTCTLTRIHHSDKEKLQVMYGDRHEEVFEENIGAKLKELVAIQEKYNTLPINAVNNMILKDVSAEEIYGKEMVAELEGLSKTHVNVELLREYVATHPKSTIPMAVDIDCPLGENYRGWEVVDTPGVDAIGGIEDDTKNFLCQVDENGNHNVDAIVFVQAATSNIEDKGLNEFVHNTINSLTDEAKKRVFFVLTHGADKVYLRNKEGILQRARQLFVDYPEIGIGEERLVVVDSMAALLETDQMLDLSSLYKNKNKPEHWDEKEWGVASDLLGDMLLNFLMDNIAFNNENLRRNLRQLSNFASLRRMLNDFVMKEKNEAFYAIINTILEEIKNCISIKEKDLEVLSWAPETKDDKIKEEKDNLLDFLAKINLCMANVRKTYSKSYVSQKFTDDVWKGISLSSFKNLSSCEEMRWTADKVGERALKVEQSIVEDIKKEVASYVDNAKLTMQVSLPSIDFDTIENNARRACSTYVTETYRVGKESGISGSVKRRWGTLCSFLGKKNDYGYVTKTISKLETDYEAANKKMATDIFDNLKTNIDEYRENVTKELNMILIEADKGVKASIESRNREFDNLVSVHKEVRERQISDLKGILCKIVHIVKKGGVL